MPAVLRVSLPDQVASFLRQGMSASRWRRELPSEAELCRELHVSRVTLRKGLAQLVRDGWLVPGGRGRHHRIRKRGGLRREAEGHTVRMLSPFSLATIGSTHHVMLEAIVERLNSAKCHLQYEHRPAPFTRHSLGELARLIKLEDTSAWILHYSTPAMQRWFADRRIPCLVLGQLSEGVELPCVFSDGPAIGRHAAGLFYQRGHRSLVYLIAEITSLNDQLCAEAFAHEAKQLGCQVRTITHPRGPAELSHALGAVLTSRPRPTAFFSTCPEHCLTTLCHLRENGLRVPADASIIAGWDDEFLHFSVPTFACYRIDGAKMGYKLAALLLDLIRHGPDKLSEVSILPKFIPGDTLGDGPLGRKTVLA